MSLKKIIMKYEALIDVTTEQLRAILIWQYRRTNSVISVSISFRDRIGHTSFQDVQVEPTMAVSMACIPSSYTATLFLKAVYVQKS